MTKRLNITNIQNELEGSAFFPGKKPADPAAPVVPSPTDTASQEKSDLPIEPQSPSPGIVVPRRHDTIADTMTPGYHDTVIPPTTLSDDEMYQAVRRAVKQIGKEPATQRLTAQEKQALMDIEYTYRRQGIKTSGNEIIRIAINFLIEEYRKNGEASILAKILTLLNS